MFEKIRNRKIRRALEQFVSEKPVAKFPDIQKLSSCTIILDENDKGIIKNIESRVKTLFCISCCRFVILCNQFSEDILQSDLYCEITPKDFGFMDVLKPEKHEFVRKLPSTYLLVNMAVKHPDISDYLSTLPRADFRVCFNSSCNIKVYDLVIENSEDADLISNVEVLYKYLTALSGGPKTQ